MAQTQDPIRWCKPTYGEAAPPDSEESWQQIVRPIVGPGGDAELLWLPDKKVWKVSEAHKSPTMQSVRDGLIDTHRVSVRCEVERALRLAGKPVLETCAT